MPALRTRPRKSAWGLLAVGVLSWAEPALAAAELCLPALAEEGRRLHEMPAPRSVWLELLLRQHEACWTADGPHDELRVFFIGNSSVQGHRSASRTRRPSTRPPCGDRRAFRRARSTRKARAVRPARPVHVQRRVRPACVRRRAIRQVLSGRWRSTTTHWRASIAAGSGRGPGRGATSPGSSTRRWSRGSERWVSSSASSSPSANRRPVSQSSRTAAGRRAGATRATIAAGTR